MKKIVRLLGANDTQVKYMDEIYEFEKKLANVRMHLTHFTQLSTP